MRPVLSTNRFLTTAALAGAITAATALPASAMETQTKQEITALSAIAVATVAAGPVGLVAGIFGGSWLAAQIENADQYAATAAALEDMEVALVAREAELKVLEQELAGARESQQRFARMALDQLQLEMLFKTGDSSLTPSGIDRLGLLATFLEKNLDLDIVITGFSDPRGNSAANLALSKARAQRVADQLMSQGINADRLQVQAYGETQSTAQEGDQDAYALERRVQIALQRRDDGRQLARVSISDD
jgi:outer membrane protein OmpA-like peptidoglycan-associated protein